jgi:hypothetical protein
LKELKFNIVIDKETGIRKTSKETSSHASEKGEHCFYLNFLEGDSFEIFATEVFLRIQD